jgi:AcrR family transcriptional regulator
VRQLYYNKTMESRAKRANLSEGRINQKLRTRRALLEAASRLVRRGLNPTLAEIAEEALVARATAYRYFSSLERLLLEAPLHDQTAAPEDLFPPDDGRTPIERAIAVHDHLHDLVAANERAFRLYLRACLDDWVRSDGEAAGYLRGARRLPMIDAALAELRPALDEQTFRQLRLSLAAMVSVESFVALRDVCGLDAARAREVMGWAVGRLVEAAARGPTCAPGSARRRSGTG